MPGNLSPLPAVRLLLPFALGIVAHRLWHNWWAPGLILVAAIGIYLIIHFQSKTPDRRLTLRPVLVIALSLAALALGWMAALINCPPLLPQEQRTGRVLQGRIVQLDFTDFSMRLGIDVLERDLPRCRVLVSTRGCDYTLSEGDLVAWQADLDEVANLGNPYEMDYAGWLRDSRSIRYQQHLPVDQLKRTGHHPTLGTRMAATRRQLALKVFNSGISPQSQHLVVALLLGESGTIDRGTRQEFSAAGIAHVLALSGLHVGMIALIVWVLLFPLDYLRQQRLRLVLTLAVIVLFAAFTGFSPSVVRSAVMIGFAFAAVMFSRRSAPLNSLCMAALIILVFSPSALYSVGFQLSFITVGAILMAGRLPKAFHSRFRAVNYVTATVFTSIIAMLATMMLTAHYFHIVSWGSVISNLLVLPVLPLFMIIGALFLLVTLAGMQWHVLDLGIDAVSDYLHWSATTVSFWPMSHVRGIYVSTGGTIIGMAALLLIVMWLYRHNIRYLMAAGCALALLLAHSLWLNALTSPQGLIVFNSFSSTPVMYYDGDIAWLWVPDEEETDVATASRFYSGFLARHGISEIKLMGHDSLGNINGGLFKPPFAHLLGHRLLAAGQGKWNSMITTRDKMPLDEIIVTKRFHGTVAKLRELYTFDRLIISGAVQPATLESLMGECDSLGINCHALAHDGAIEINPIRQKNNHQ